MNAPLLTLEGVTKRFGGIVATDDVSLKVDDEGLTALIGPNGAGKTTLFNLITGKFAPTSGTITFRDTDITGLDPRERVKLGIGRSFQVTNIFNDLSVRKNVRTAVTARMNQRFDPISTVGTDEEIAAEVDELLSLLDLDGVAETQCSELAYGDQRRVEIAVTLGTDPDLVLLDEPTAGLNPVETSEFIDLLEEIYSETGKSFFIIEHDMDVVFSTASRVIVLNQGAILADGTPEEVQRDENVRSAYLGTDSLAASRNPDTETTARQNTNQPFLRLTDLNTYYGQSHILHDLSMDVMRGEVVALLGRNGAGKTTTLRSIIGTASPKSGSVRFDGTEVQGDEPYELSRAGIGYVPQDRRVFPDLTVEENLKVILAEDSEWNLERLYELFPRLNERRNLKGKNLSGGEQQMLSIARALAVDPKLLLLDEPSEGLAPVIVTELRENLVELIEQTDITILLTEQNSELAFSLADWVYVMNKGQIVWSGTPTELRQRDEIVDRYLAVTESGG